MSDAKASIQWVSNTLINIADYHNGAAFKAKDWVEDGLPIIRIEQLNNSDAETDKYNGFLHPNNSIDDGDLIFSWSATLKVIIWNRGPGALNQHLYKVVPKQGIDRHLLLQILDFNMNRLSGQSQGSTMKHVTRKELSRFFVKYPSGEKEQKKISRILQTIDQSIEKTEALIEKYQQIKAGLMHDLFTRGIGPDGKLRPPREQAPELYQETPIGWIPKEWHVPELAELCAHEITYGIVQAGPHIDTGIPYIRTGDMSGDALIKDGLLRTSPKIAASFKRSEVRSGEIVCAIRATVGKVLIVPDELDGANLTQGTARISPLETVDTNFILWGFRSDAVQRAIKLSIKGTTFNEITLGDLRKLRFLIPKKVAEQNIISGHLDSCERRISNEKGNLQKLKKQKLGLMHDLLTGKVEVNAD